VNLESVDKFTEFAGNFLHRLVSRDGSGARPCQPLAHFLLVFAATLRNAVL
jgi:hypothetical protein